MSTQQLKYASSIRAHESQISTLENGNRQNANRISELKSELTQTLPRKERRRQERLAARQARQTQRDVIASDINKSKYLNDSVKSTLSSDNIRHLDHNIIDAYAALRSTKTLIFNDVKSQLYDQFFTELDTELPNLSLSKKEEEALRLIKRNLSDHFRTVEEAKRANTTLLQSQSALRDARALVTKGKERLSTLQASNPALKGAIEGLETANRTHNGLLVANQVSRKQWGRGTTVCVVLTLLVASPLIVYGAGALSLSAVALGLISSGASALGLGSIVGGIKTLLLNWAINRESQTIERNTLQIGEKNRQISQEAREIKALEITGIPDAEKEVARLAKVVEGNESTLESLYRQAAQYKDNAASITPTSLSQFAQSPVVASAPPKDLLTKNEGDYPPDSELPAYSLTA